MYLKIKYLQDFVLSFFLLPFVFTLIALHCCIHVIIFRSNPFFISNRVGQNNKEFKIFKLKTMVENAPFLSTARLTNPEKYVTEYGNFLRKSSLDEVPQLLNVLKGEMTLVGPRPGLTIQVDLLRMRDERGLACLRPGITGLAQVAYRDSASDRLKVKVDELYFKNAGICLDFWILIKTVRQVFFPVNVRH